MVLDVHGKEVSQGFYEKNGSLVFVNIENKKPIMNFYNGNKMVLSEKLFPLCPIPDLKKYKERLQKDLDGKKELIARFENKLEKTSSEPSNNKPNLSEQSSKNTLSLSTTDSKADHELDPTN